jgi:hypothetical protein
MKKGENKFIVYPNNLDGIEKRGAFITHRNNGKVANPTGPSSIIGWGPVPSTVITVQKDLDTSLAKQQMLISQLCVGNYLEKEPTQKRMKSTTKPIAELPSVVVSELPEIKATPLIEEWYEYCQQNLDKGMIGLVPDCFQQTLPPLSELMCTNIGKCLLNFSRFTKNKF